MSQKRNMKTVFYAFLLLCAPLLLPAQALAPDEKNALLHVEVTDFQDHPLKNETIVFKGKATHRQLSCTSDAAGKCELLLPKGDTYLISYLSFVEEKDYSEIAVPDEPGIMEATLGVQLESNRKEMYELDIRFETGSSVIRSESFPMLNRLASQMKLKPTVLISLAGHTDSEGEEAANLTLSRARAEAIKTFLLQKGITASRIKTEGFGESKPIADNGSAEGRARNRRTEVRVTQW